MMPDIKLPDKPLVLFDGVCNLCNGAVLFIIRHDSAAQILFTSLQSPRGQAISKHFGFKTEDFDTFIFVENQQAYVRSTGMLRLLKRLGGLWQVLYFFIVIPRPIRDFLYSLLARNRYRLFGKKDQCMIPTPELKSRFLT